MREALDQADSLADRFEQHEPDAGNILDATALALVARAVEAREAADERLASAVQAARVDGHSWAAIGAMLGITGEAARQKYRDGDVTPVLRSLPLKRMAKAGWIDDSPDMAVLATGIRALSGGGTELPLQVAARRKDGGLSWTPEQLAWLLRARELALAEVVEPYDHQAAEKLAASIAQLSVSDSELKEVPALLAEVGIRLVLLPQLPGSKVDGACFWLDQESPVVALSLRYDRIDYFLFTLAHELAHLIRGDASPDQPMIDLDESFIGEIEEAANALAASWLLPVKDEQLPSAFSEILKLGRSLDVAPGVIVGRLHHLGVIPYSKHRSTLTKVRHLFGLAGA